MPTPGPQFPHGDDDRWVQGELFPTEWQSNDDFEQLELPLGVDGAGPGNLPPADSSLDVVDAFDDSEDPTSTTNPERPRTLLAGYRLANRTMYVMFRDGTFWEYRNVPPLLWANFKRAYSKGWFLYKSGLDNWPDMGPGSLQGLPPRDLEVFRIRAQIAQTRLRGVPFGKSAPYMGRLKRQDAGIKRKGVTVSESNARISNPYIESAKRAKRPKI